MHHQPPLPLDPADVKGFLDPDEGRALYDAALATAPLGPIVEIGGYCGKSALYIGTAARLGGSVLFSIDHHRGSEENQPGWDWHDPALWDEDSESLDTLPAFRRTIRRADLEEHVVALIGRSATIAPYWQSPIAMLFVDGGHTMAAALADWIGWGPKVMPNGILAIHDVFPDPADGGQAPFEIYRLAIASGLFAEIQAVKSLRLLRRL